MMKTIETHNLHGREKLDHILTYYKLPIFLGILFVFLAGSQVRHLVTKKEIVLYVGIVNIAASEELLTEVRRAFLADAYPGERRTDIEILNALYLKEDPAPEETEYVRASEVKFLGSVTAGRMDAVITNESGLALLEQGGWIDTDTVTALKSSAFSAHGIKEDLYLALIGNTTRKETALQFQAVLNDE